MGNEELDFKIGDDEVPATVEMDDNGENAVVTDKEEAPLVETAANKRDELDQYGDKVQKRIDKLTGRLRETQRREEAAVEYARNVQNRANELEQRFQRSDAERLVEAKGRIDTQMVALKQIIKKAREVAPRRADSRAVSVNWVGVSSPDCKAAEISLRDHWISGS
jgi:hypothetical protein